MRAGLSAGIASELMVAACSLREANSANVGVNATGQWLRDSRARHKPRPRSRYRRGASIRDTMARYAIHQLCSFLWSALYAAWNARRPTQRSSVRLRRAAAVGVLAAAVDHRLTPRRLRPGFEAHLGRASVAGMYAAFALGLYLAASRREDVAPPHREAHAERGG